MKLTLSFIFVAIALLQMTAASPIVEEVEKRDRTKFAHLVARDPSDVDDIQGNRRKNIAYSVAEDLSEVEEVEKRGQKKFAHLVSRDPSDADDIQGNRRKNIAYSVAEDLSDAADIDQRDKKTASYIVAEESRDVEGVVEGVPSASSQSLDSF
ncbi:hypothetical protein BDR03DRAFT_960636 [Suillus americanus]|nr:hypothetical protein BDR03DRAFT_960636 [Suillus americanus]